MHWSKAQINKASKLWQDGQAVQVIADRLGISKRAVTHCASKYRDLFPLRALVKTYSDEQLKNAAHLWNSGHGAAHIAREVGVSTNTFYSMRKSNIQLFTRATTSKKMDYLGDAPILPKREQKPISLNNCFPVIVVPLPYAKALDEQRCLYFAADIMSHEGLDMPVCGLPRMQGIRQPYCAQHYHAAHYVEAGHE